MQREQKRRSDLSVVFHGAKLQSKWCCRRNITIHSARNSFSQLTKQAAGPQYFAKLRWTKSTPAYNSVLPTSPVLSWSQTSNDHFNNLLNALVRVRRYPFCCMWTKNEREKKVAVIHSRIHWEATRKARYHIKWHITQVGIQRSQIAQVFNLLEE